MKNRFKTDGTICEIIDIVEPEQEERNKVQINDAFDASHVATFWGWTLAGAHLTAYKWAKENGYTVTSDKPIGALCYPTGQVMEVAR